jgi:hypothetical protein
MPEAPIRSPRRIAAQASSDFSSHKELANWIRTQLTDAEIEAYIHRYLLDALKDIERQERSERIEKQARELKQTSRLAVARSNGFASVAEMDAAVADRDARHRRKALAAGFTSVKAYNDHLFDRRADQATQRLTQLAEWAKIGRKFTTAFLNSTFPLPDGKEIKWSDATAAQHRRVLSMLEKSIKGMARNADLHREAIRLLSESGLRCLGDLKAAA